MTVNVPQCQMTRLFLRRHEINNIAIILIIKRSFSDKGLHVPVTVTLWG